MRFSAIWLAVAGTFAALGAGCSAPPCPTEPTVARVTAETPAAYECLWTAAGDTLRSHYFRLDRQDRLDGIITTFPETCAQFFELWRPQPEPAYYWVEANLHTIPLEAKVTIKPIDVAGTYELGVQVDQMRFHLEERQIDNSAGAMRLYSDVAPTESGRMEKPSKTEQTTVIGRDKPAEERLLKSILKRYAKASIVEAPCGPSEEEVIIEEKPETPATQPG
jgi:hypothetical protein